MIKRPKVHPRGLTVEPVPMEHGEGKADGGRGRGVEASRGSVESEELAAEEAGRERGDRGGMLPPTTSAWLRARFKDEVSSRFRGAAAAAASAATAKGGEAKANGNGNRGVEGEGGGGGGGGASGGASKKSTALQVSFSLPLASYATTLLQHLTGEGLGGGRKAWGAGEGGGGGESREGRGDVHEEEEEDFEGEEEEYSASGDREDGREEGADGGRGGRDPRSGDAYAR